MKKYGIILLAAVVSASLVPVVTGSEEPAAAIDNGLALTPPMGWNDWNSFGCDIDEQDVIDTIDLFVETGLRDAGYEYINIDDCWGAATRDADGRLQADPVDFPHGIAYLADYAHANGLLLGIYSSAGSTTCQRVQPGSLGHEYIDALTFAEWGVDYLKYDNCGTQEGYENTQESYEARYQVMADAIAQVAEETGRTLLYSVCEWGNWEPWTWADDQANLWRTTFDIADTYSSMLGIFEDNVVLAEYASPGAWNDPDMLQVGNGGMTTAEYRSHFSLWAMMAAPLLIGTDLREADAETMDIFLNEDVIAIDQDTLGVQAEVVSDADGLYVLTKPLSNGDTAVALFNSTDTNQVISTTTEQAEVGSSSAYDLTDLWSKEVTETTGDISAFVNAHETIVYRVSAASDSQVSAPSTTLNVTSESVSVAPGGSTTVTVTLTSAGRADVQNAKVELSAPAGWSVKKTSTSHKGAVLQQTYRLTAPKTSTEPITAADLTATATYKWKSRNKATKTSTITVYAVGSVQSPYSTADTTGTDALFGQLDDVLAIRAAGAGVGPTTSSFTGTTPGADEYGSIFLDDSLDADDEVQVTVSDHEGTTSGDLSGILVRNDQHGDGTPVGVALYVTGEGQIGMTYATDGGTAYTATYPPRQAGPPSSEPGLTGPVTLKLVRSGATYVGYYSVDGGSTFTRVGGTDGSVTVAVGAAATLQDAGAFHTSGAAGQSTTTTFTGLNVS